MNLMMAFVWFLIGFTLINCVKFLQLSRTLQKLKTKPENANAQQAALVQLANKKTLPYLPVYYLIIWILCSSFFITGDAQTINFSDALKTGILWLALSFLFELMSWTLLKHPYRLSGKAMYKDSQPWISIMYYAILISPVLVALAKI